MAESITRMDPIEPGDASTPLRPASRWNRIAVAAPLIGVGAGVIVLLAGLPGDGEWGWGALWVAILLVAASVLIGLMSAVLAYTRSERRPALTALGFVVNVLPLLAVLVLMALND